MHKQEGAGRFELPTFGFAVRRATHCAIPPLEQDHWPCIPRLRARGVAAWRKARARELEGAPLDGAVVSEHRDVRTFFVSDRPPYSQGILVASAGVSFLALRLKAERVERKSRKFEARLGNCNVEIMRAPARAPLLRAARLQR